MTSAVTTSFVGVGAISPEAGLVTTGASWLELNARENTAVDPTEADLGITC